MQTFLPYPDFAQSAQCLDRQRLCKQRVEVFQLLRALNGETRGWTNHPAAKMWRGYNDALAWYGLVICNEWLLRGYRDTCFGKIREYMRDWPPETPPWLGGDVFHESHRSNLLRKDPTWYSQWGWTEPNDLPYVWPV